MRWQGGRESENIEDRRYDDRGDEGGGFPFPGGGGGGGFSIPIGQGGGGLISILIIVGIALLLGVDPRVIFEGGGGESYPGNQRQIPLPSDRSPRMASPQDDMQKKFVATILANTEDTWSKIFRDMGRSYRQPRLVLFRGTTQSGCGLASSQMGPFYCPNNEKIYIDLNFFELLKRRFNAPGEFAQAYVIAHEVGHHVQKMLSALQTARRRQAAAYRDADRNGIQVQVELQADCYAGVWAKTTDQIKKILEPGDIEAALNAASAIGDDAIQRQAGGTVAPDSFTHGTSEQRVRWFRRGYEGGTINSCDTFSQNTL